MQKRYSRPPLSTLLPFGLWRVDKYFSLSYIKTFFLIIAALAALVAIGDIFQRFDDIIIFSRNNDLDLGATGMLFLRYYSAFVPQLVFQYMFPLSMLLAAAITATSAYAGPRGNNEYVVLRSVGVSVRRALLPLIVPALIIAVAFQASRDYFLPYMVRESSSILNDLRNRTSMPVDISLVHGDDFHTAAIGWFSPQGIAYNLILETRDVRKYQRGDAAAGDNDFVAYRASRATLEPRPGGDGYQWRPLENAEVQIFSRFSRRVEPWAAPVATSLSPAMIDRQTLGDAVCSWSELLAMQKDNSGARFEIHWRLADPVACGLLILWGMSICMGRMLRGKSAGYIHAVAVSMVAAGLFYVLRLFGKSLWESAVLSPAEAAWLPLAVALLATVPTLIWMER